MTSHRDKLRSRVPSQRYKERHEQIFGPPTGNRDATPEELERMAESRKHHHAKLAEDGRKPADWYLQNERRVPMNPNFVPGHAPTRSYRQNYAQVFGGKRKTDDA